LRFTPTAQADIAHVYENIAADHPAAARRVARLSLWRWQSRISLSARQSLHPGYGRMSGNSCVAVFNERVNIAAHAHAEDRTRSHKIAQDRTRHLFDCALLIEYWRNAHVELRPQPAGRFYVLINVAVLARTYPAFHRCTRPLQRPRLQPKIDFRATLD